MLLPSLKNKMGHPCMEELKSSQCCKIIQSYTYLVLLEVLVLKGVMSLQIRSLAVRVLVIGSFHLKFWDQSTSIIWLSSFNVHVFNTYLIQSFFRVYFEILQVSFRPNGPIKQDFTRGATIHSRGLSPSSSPWLRGCEIGWGLEIWVLYFAPWPDNIWEKNFSIFVHGALSHTEFVCVISFGLEIQKCMKVQVGSHEI